MCTRCSSTANRRSPAVGKSGVPEEARVTRNANREGHDRRNSALRPVPRRTRHDGLQASALPHDKVLASLTAPGFLLKIIPHVDGSPRICELVRYYCEDVTVKGAWEGPAALELMHHALAPVASLPVREVLSGVHILCDLTLGLGTVVHDYLATPKGSA